MKFLSLEFYGIKSIKKKQNEINRADTTRMANLQYNVEDARGWKEGDSTRW